MMGNKLYVGNLDGDTSAEELKTLFAGAGQVTSAQVITDRETRRSKGFGFVEMASEAEALQGISLYNGYLLNDRPLIVSEARAREDRPTRGDGDRRAHSNDRPQFREIKHKSRGGAKRRY
jgi:RNA recognition motif-containing protein